MGLAAWEKNYEGFFGRSCDATVFVFVSQLGQQSLKEKNKQNGREK
jgi:hypothetical protein